LILVLVVWVGPAIAQAVAGFFIFCNPGPNLDEGCQLSDGQFLPDDCRLDCRR